MKTLIIRTDRLGDFYLTIPYINSLIRNYGKKNIDILVKKHIFFHIKKKKYLFNKIFYLPKNGILKKIFLIDKLRKNKYKQIIIFDGKDRSIILSKLLNTNKIYHTYPLKKKNYLTNLLFSEKFVTCFDNQVDTLDSMFKKVLMLVGVKINKKDYKILSNKSIKKISFLKNEKIIKKKYILFHIDEKWFSNSYIKTYHDISPKVDDFYEFIKKIVKNKKCNILITTGSIPLTFINQLSNKYFKTNKNIYSYKKIGNFKVILLCKVSIEDLETITMNAKTLITCHGPLVQISGSFNVKLIDIINKGSDKWYYRHTSHIKKYKKLYRKRFNTLSGEIMSSI